VNERWFGAAAPAGIKTEAIKCSVLGDNSSTSNTELNLIIMRTFLFICCLAVLVCAAPNEPQNAAWNVNLNTSSDPAFFFGGWSGHSYFPSPDDWRKHPVYQFVTDRFADGNPLVSYSLPLSRSSCGLPRSWTLHFGS